MMIVPLKSDPGATTGYLIDDSHWVLYKLGGINPKLPVIKLP